MSVSGALLTAKRAPSHGWHHTIATAGSLGAVLAAVVALLVAVALLWPRSWDFRPNSEQIEAKAQSGGSALELTRGMALAMNVGWRKNNAALARLHTLFSVGLLAVAATYVLVFIAKGASL